MHRSKYIYQCFCNNYLYYIIFDYFPIVLCPTNVYLIWNYVLDYLNNDLSVCVNEKQVYFSIHRTCMLYTLRWYGEQFQRPLGSLFTLWYGRTLLFFCFFSEVAIHEQYGMASWPLSVLLENGLKWNYIM